MDRNDFRNIMNDLKFDNKDKIYLIRHNMDCNIFEYTPREIKYIKQMSHMENNSK